LVNEGGPGASLVTYALMIAVWRRGKADALLHHSDQGSQYTSEQFQRLLLDNGITCSMSRAGNVWDNSAMESFFSSMKTERTARKVYRTRDAARADVFDYIERFYNPRRRHSKLGYLSPMAFEERAMQTYLRQASSFSSASAKVMNQFWFRHSVRKRPLNASMNALSVGFPGREKSRTTPRL
jgi:hypothetical protein